MLIKHVLLDPKSNSRYEDVKQIVLKAVRPSERARLEQLCGKLQLGDKRPSLLLREMQQLMGTTYMHDSLLQEFWLQRLPDYTQALLAASPAKTLSELADSADSIHDRLPSTRFTIASTSSAPTNCQSCSSCSSLASKEEEIKTLRAALERLTLPTTPVSNELSSTLAALTRAVQDFQPRRHPRDRSFSRTRGVRRRTPSRDGSGICWYHWKHGKDAQNCRPPCTYRPAQGN